MLTKTRNQSTVRGKKKGMTLDLLTEGNTEKEPSLYHSE